MADLLDISAVLTLDYLSQKLSEWFKTDVKYSRHEYCGTTAKGEGYLSDMYRMIFYGKPTNNSEEVSIAIVLKALPSNIGTRKTFRSETFFRNEINFYEQIVPVFLKFQSEKKMTEPFESLPRVFASFTNGVDDILALEDLSLLGYGCAVRQEGIDYLHCQKILETFAKFHSLSFAFRDQHPEEYAKLALTVPERYYDLQFWDWYKGFWKAICETAIDAVEKEYPNTIYAEKIKDFATPKTFAKMAEATGSKTSSKVIGHGDSWTPNFLFKYKPDTIIPTDSMMIDFQLARSGSPILDIAFFIYAVSSKELRDEHYTDMLKHYHGILTRQIKEMGSDPDKVYSWDMFMDEVKKFSYFGVGFSMESTPVIILPPEEAFDVNGITGTEAVGIETIWTIKPIKSKEGRQRLAGIIIHAVDNGYI